MTPKEKAEELWFKFFHKQIDVSGDGAYKYSNGFLHGELAYQCALIAVDEIINELEGTNSTKEGLFFWMDVKQEIEKL